MPTARFRFFAELNDFLPRERRQREIACSWFRDATAKHMIEALGVPHTEVELIALNGAPAGFGQLLQEGDRLDVYPDHSAGIVLGDMNAYILRPGYEGRPRFVADAHMGGLARLLRRAGFDTLYSNTFQDSEIARISESEQRIVLTRDRDLLKQKNITYGCYLHARLPEQQWQELLQRWGLAQSLKPFSLCVECNTPLHAVEPAAIAHRVPPRVLQRYQEFTMCDCCRRVYWPGSHWERMQQVLRDQENKSPCNGNTVDSSCTGSIR
jgi:uncharacterized protein with PIN domain